MIGCEILTKMRSLPFYAHIRTAEVLLRHEIVLALAGSLNSDYAGSKHLCISHLNKAGLHTPTTQQMLILNRATGDFVDNPYKVYFFHAPTFYTRALLFLGKLRIVLGHLHTNSASELAEFLNISMFHSHSASIFHLRVSFTSYVSIAII